VRRDAETDGNDGTTRLTEYSELHGCSCKVGQSDLDSLLADAGLSGDSDQLLFGIGEDAAARKLTDDLALVSTVDFFTPIVDDPYDFGRIAACNAASDAFATGAVENIDCLVVLGLPRELTDSAAGILAGMADALDTMGGVIAGGHTLHLLAADIQRKVDDVGSQKTLRRLRCHGGFADRRRAVSRALTGGMRFWRTEQVGIARSRGRGSDDEAVVAAARWTWRTRINTRGQKQKEHGRHKELTPYPESCWTAILPPKRPRST
jgi:selenide,water dikinase